MKRARRAPRRQGVCVSNSRSRHYSSMVLMKNQNGKTKKKIDESSHMSPKRERQSTSEHKSVPLQVHSTIFYPTCTCFFVVGFGLTSCSSRISFGLPGGDWKTVCRENGAVREARTPRKEKRAHAILERTSSRKKPAKKTAT